MIKTCPSCNNKFNARRSVNIFCSVKCYDLQRTKKEIKHCLHCHKIMYLTKYQNDRQKFCSYKCAADYRIKNNIMSKRPHLGYITKNCLMCHKEFTISINTHKKRQKKSSVGGCFCSLSCRAIYQMKYQNPKKRTTIEIAMKSALEKLNISFDEQFKIGNYLPDFVIHEYKIVIECDGDYWHSLERVKKRDKRKDKYLKSKGWKVIRFSETNINNNLSWCLSILLHELDMTIDT